MSDLIRGIVAGFLATVVITLLMAMRMAAGIMPWFNPIEVMNLSVHTLLNVPPGQLAGWVIHFGVGSLIWGGIFGLLGPTLPGRSYAIRGLLFGTLAWFLVMVTLFPLAGSGLFGMGFGAIVPLTTLISHWIFGLVLGGAYGWLKRV